jgi:hypothetical protein
VNKCKRGLVMTAASVALATGIAMVPTSAFAASVSQGVHRDKDHGHGYYGHGHGYYGHGYYDRDRDRRHYHPRVFWTKKVVWYHGHKRVIWVKHVVKRWGR